MKRATKLGLSILAVLACLLGVTIALAAPTISTLMDRFQNNVINTGLWNTFTTTATVAAANNELEETLNSSTINADVGILSNTTTYDLTGTSVFVRVKQVSSGNTLTTLKLVKDGTNSIELRQVNGNLVARQTVAGAGVDKATLAYSAATMQWWRVRESGGTTFWDYSADGVVWTTLFSEANPITVTALQIDMESFELASVAAPGKSIFDNFNIAPQHAGLTIRAGAYIKNSGMTVN